MPPDAEAPLHGLKRRHAGLRVLVAEDDEACRLLMAELMADAGLPVDAVVDGQEAIEAVARRPYGMVLLDLRMPRLDGIAAARRIRQMPGGERLPMIAVTANAFDDDCRAFQAVGVERILPKPVDPGQLYRVMLELLEPGCASVAAAAPEAVLPPGLAAVAACDGVDVTRGLAAVGGREAVYRRLLGVFVASHAADGTRAVEHLRAGQAVEAGMLVHRLRGSAATLGLVDVEGAAAGLEEALHAGRADCAALANTLAATLADTVRSMQAALAD